jgi:DNA replication protein DnaC
MEMPEMDNLSFEERLGLLVDEEITARENRRLESRLKQAKLRQAAMIEDLNLRKHRGLDRSVLSALAALKWIRSHQNILIIGKTGSGKTYLACALAHKACREGFTAFYQRATRMFEELGLARGDGRYPKVLSALFKKDVLLIDDLGLNTLTPENRHDLLEIVEERYERKSTIITSQLPVENWHEIIGEPTIADAILDRIVHNAHRINLKGGSMRKERAAQQKKVEF